MNIVKAYWNRLTKITSTLSYNQQLLHCFADLENYRLKQPFIVRTRKQAIWKLKINQIFQINCLFDSVKTVFVSNSKRKKQYFWNLWCYKNDVRIFYRQDAYVETMRTALSKSTIFLSSDHCAGGRKDRCSSHQFFLLSNILKIVHSLIPVWFL